MTALLLLGLIYVVLGGLTALLIRVLGLFNAFHYECEGCRGGNKWAACNFIGRGPLTLFGWLAAIVWWPVIWLYGVACCVFGVLYWVGTREF